MARRELAPGTKLVQVNVSEELHGLIKHLATLEQVPISSLVRDAVKAYSNDYYDLPFSDWLTFGTMTSSQRAEAILRSKQMSELAARRTRAAQRTERQQALVGGTSNE